MGKWSLAALAVTGVLALSGCAHVAADDADDADEQASYCQTDDTTGSRLAPKTTCHTGTDTESQKAVRGVQNK